MIILCVRCLGLRPMSGQTSQQMAGGWRLVLENSVFSPSDTEQWHFVTMATLNLEFGTSSSGICREDSMDWMCAAQANRGVVFTSGIQI